MSDPTDATAWLASELGTHTLKFVEAAGGGWRRVTLRPPVHPEPIQWFATGDPTLALLGLSEGHVLIARPDSVRGGLAGPPRLTAKAVTALQRNGDVISALGRAVSAAITAERRRWGLCQGCRSYLPVSRHGDISGRYCDGCQYDYLGIIAC